MADDAGDLLADAGWECAALPAGAVDDPRHLAAARPVWWPATVPGTAAGAVRAAGVREVGDYDVDDWWFRCRFAAPAGGGGPGRGGLLHIGGIATVSDTWLNGRHIVRSESMFASHAIAVPELERENELLIRCSSLARLLAERRPRPRWKTNLVKSQNLRWYRTTLLGRIPGWAETPAPVGPWRRLRLISGDVAEVLDRRIVASCSGDDGMVEVAARVRLPGPVATEAALEVGAAGSRLEMTVAGDLVSVAGTVRLPQAERWWPHTHGAQPRYPVVLEIGGHRFDLGAVGFRTVGVDRADGGFRLSINGQPIFCRGACFLPPDPVGLAADEALVRSTLLLAREANMNMLRLPGTAVYAEDHFFDLCDELGMMVWQDLMLAFVDPPDDEQFNALFETEARSELGRLGGRPSLAVVCGGQEVEEVAAMMGLEEDRSHVPLIEERFPAIAAECLPGVPYVSSNPTGGPLPFVMDHGVCQYFGVGGYLRPLEDARRAGVRFAAECLAFATPPERATVEEQCGGAESAGHQPEWKRGVHHDAGRSWDLEDVRDHYVAQLFGTEALHERYVDAERALDLGRATNARLTTAVISEWRRSGSTCDGALVLALRDLRAGAGWGVIDASGRPKSTWYALKRVFAPRCLLLTDEGLNGLRLHVLNDSGEELAGRVVVDLYAHGELHAAGGEQEVKVAPRSSVVVDAAQALGTFRDISYAYRFGPPPHDVVSAMLVDADEGVVDTVVHLPLGERRDLEPDVGLRALVRCDVDGRWLLDISTRRFAHFVVVESPDARPSDSWFHLVPGAHRLVVLTGAPADRTPRGRVRSLNSRTQAAFEMADV